MLQLFQVLGVDQAGLIVDVLRDIDAAVLLIDFTDDGFDGRITLDQSTFAQCQYGRDMFKAGKRWHPDSSRRLSMFDTRHNDATRLTSGSARHDGG